MTSLVELSRQLTYKMAVLRTAFLLLPLCQLFNADESEVQPKTGQINVTKNYKLYANLSGANWKIPEILEVNSFLINTETAAPETKEPLVPKALYKKPKREKQVRKKRKAEVVTTWSSTTLDLNYTNVSYICTVELYILSSVTKNIK